MHTEEEDTQATGNEMYKHIKCNTNTFIKYIFERRRTLLNAQKSKDNYKIQI